MPRPVCRRGSRRWERRDRCGASRPRRSLPISSLSVSQSPTADDLDARIRALEGLDPAALRASWTEVYGAPPPRWGRTLLLRSLAHRLQEHALGGLTPALRRQLADLTATLAQDPNALVTAPPRIKPGTRLIRDWRGERHQVTVLEDGFTYRDQRFRSLSAIARTITGTPWSGPAFFGLRARRRANGKHRG